MTSKQFDTLMGTRRHRGRTLDALRLILVKGLSANAAAKKLSLDASTVLRALDGVTTRGTCPHCGQDVRSVKPPQ